MPRASDGTYTLPAGNPVVTDTYITISWANATLADIAAELQDSLSRSGKGNLTAQLKAIDGSNGAPAYSFASSSSSGLYFATGTYAEVKVSANNTYCGKFYNSSADFPNLYSNGYVVALRNNLNLPMWDTAIGNAGTKSDATALNLYTWTGGISASAETLWADVWFWAQTSAVGVGLTFELASDQGGRFATTQIEYSQWQSLAGPPTIVQGTAVNTAYGSAVAGNGTTDRLYRATIYAAISAGTAGTLALNVYDGSGAGAGSITVSGKPLISYWRKYA